LNVVEPVMKSIALFTALALAGCSAQSKPAAQNVEPVPASAAHPAVIELYQSQGCSSCPPALAVLDELARRPDVLALNFAVTYWDQLGWKDSFAQPAFTARQWEFARAQGRGNVQTPQLIINGRIAVLGSRKGEVEAAIAANPRASGPAIVATDGVVAIGAGKPTNATVWLVDYDPRRIAVPIRAGENGGRTLVHTDVVHRLTALGGWTGTPVQLKLPIVETGLRRAVLVQAVLVQNGTGGPIVAAERL
jgi:hypothetical protein